MQTQQAIQQRALPRLPRECYEDHAYVFWTHTMENRATGWLTSGFHAQFRELLLHTLARHGLVCPVYCLMPDHIHLVWLGIRLHSDQRQAAKFLRQHMARALVPVELQKQPHDHVLREKERERGAFELACHYVRENPVRAKLAANWPAYPYTDAMIPGYPELDLRADDYWFRFWRVYAYLRDDENGT